MYEDWYVVADFTALGGLNEAAVTGARRGPHDAVAAAAGPGTAGLYARWYGHSGPDTMASPRSHRWFAKPDGMSYEDLRAALVTHLPEGVVVWQRQLTLGPAPELVVVATAPVDLPWPTLDLRQLR